MSDEFAQYPDDSSAHVIALEQHVHIKIETLRGKSMAKINRTLIEICGDDAVNRTTIQRWFRYFRESPTSIEDNPRSGRPSIITGDNIEGNTNACIIATLLEEDRRIMVKETEAETNISKSSV